MKVKNRRLARLALSNVAAATVLTLGAVGTPAWGLGLGRLSVQSALGETLKAEIDITSLSAEEASSLNVRIAPPEVYRSSGVDYNSVLPGTRVQVVNSGGRTLLRVSSDRAVQEPFIDVILEMTWASGRLVREYTLLFDPPTTPKPVVAPPAMAATEPVAPPPPAVATALPVAPPAPAPMPTPAPRPVPSRPRVEAPKPEVRAEAPAATPAPPKVAASAPAHAPMASEYTVKPGDTLSRIAGKTQAPGISLDQMLVGLYRSNPDAFIGSNMNRLKSGVVLQVPGADSLGAVTPDEAHQVIQAQSADFNAYRQRLAGAAPTLQQDDNERQAKGKVQAAVEDRKAAAAAAPDKLTLSKAASAAAEAKVSKETEKRDAANRVAELTRNVEELKKLSNAAKPAPAPAPVVAPAPAPAPVAVAAAPTPAPAPVSTPASQPEPAAASAPAVVVPVPVAMPASKPASVLAAAPTPPARRPEPGLMDWLMDNPVIPLGVVLAALVAGLGYYRLRGRKAGGKVDTGFHESRLQPDSFFGATGGQRVDTRDAPGGASSMSYSLSQLDAIGDVDPVAEADVYLAYGRDLQAEEILKEALRANPERLAIRLKLLEVYAKRRDTKGFEQLAVQLYAETHGVGDDWGRAQELGRQIDPENPLYQPGGAPSHPASGPDIHPEPMDASTLPQTVSTPTGHLATEPLALNVTGPDTGPMSGFDLDLDLDLAAPPPPAPPVSPIAMDATQALATTVEQAPLAMDFDLSTPPPAIEGAPDLQFDLDDYGAGDIPKTIRVTKPIQDVPVTKPAVAPAKNNALDFDLGSIDLDLPEPHVKTVVMPVPESAAPDSVFSSVTEQPHASLEGLGDLGQAELEDPLQRQLELADEFRQIGDTEGAREVLQELIGKASGELKAKAQAMLKELR